MSKKTGLIDQQYGVLVMHNYCGRFIVAGFRIGGYYPVFRGMSGQSNIKLSNFCFITNMTETDCRATSYGSLTINDVSPKFCGSHSPSD